MTRFKPQIVIVILFICFGVYNSYADCPQGITGYWHLDEGTTGLYSDNINANDGTCTSACPTPDSSGVVANGQAFNADTVSIPANDNLNWSVSQSFTIELWMYRDTFGLSSLEVFVGRADAAGLNWYIGVNSSGNAVANLLDVNAFGPAKLTGLKDIRSDSATWHHVAFVRDAETATNELYVDGELEASRRYSYTSGFASATAPLSIGSLNGGSFFKGSLDEIAVYAAALNESEIKSHYYVARGYCSQYDPPVKIMALGDSITKGLWNAFNPSEANMVGYRWDLWTLLKNNFFLVDFIGSEQNGTGVDPAFDDEHAGFPGIPDYQLLTLLQTGYNEFADEQVISPPGPYLDSYPAEVVLLHIGTNQLESSAADVADVLDEIDSFSKNTTVLLARIIDRTPFDGTVTVFNNNVESMVASRVAHGDKIIMVDMETGAELNYTADTTSPYDDGDMYSDLIHPNPSGYSKMAGKWFETLETILPQSEVPLITSAALTDAIKGQTYTYTVAAMGPPAPTFSLTKNPTGMTIDPVTGLIQWTPDSVGDFEIALRADNWAGQDVQAFTLHVNAQPQAVADNYSGISEGDTLAVLSTNGVLQNDTDENDLQLTAILVESVDHGSLILNSDGSFTYNNDGSGNNIDGFIYKASDGKAESEAVAVTISISPVNDDNIAATPVNDDNTASGGGGCFIQGLLPAAWN